MLRIGFVGFGGGSALIPLFEAEFLSEKQLESTSNFKKCTLIACLTPGALPVELASGIGYYLFGRKGMLGGAIAVSLPGVLLTLFLMPIFSSQHGIIQVISKLLSISVFSFVIFLLLHYIIKTIRAIPKGCIRLRAIILCVSTVYLTGETTIYRLLGVSWLPICGISAANILIAVICYAYTSNITSSPNNKRRSLMLFCFFIICHFKIFKMWIPAAKIISEVVMFVFVAITTVKKKNYNPPNIQINIVKFLSETFPWFALLLFSLGANFAIIKTALSFLQLGTSSVLLSFGGGDAFISIAESIFVDAGFISRDFFYNQVVALVNLLPGSILCKVLSCVGYFWSDGYTFFQKSLFSLMAYCCSISLSGLVFIGGSYIYDLIPELGLEHIINNYVQPTIAGSLVKVVLSLIIQYSESCHMLGIHNIFSAIILISFVAGNAYLFLIKRKSNVTIICTNIILTFLLFVVLNSFNLLI